MRVKNDPTVWRALVIDHGRGGAEHISSALCLNRFFPFRFSFFKAAQFLVFILLCNNSEFYMNE